MQHEHYCLSMTMFHRHTREMTDSNFASSEQPPFHCPVSTELPLYY